ncbi:class I SAM-dependent DNA methyltransferase [Sphingomonas adhaesiva]|uniref:class I SAM-dependent DNA methyltransferase n=1 Tax=Sphingomonas adhaesiva TaxID=28212 RepID=UPI002FF8247D
MTNDVQRHYDDLLAAHYSWMSGLPFAQKVDEQRALLTELGVAPTGLAVDLGCGPGYQSCALSDIGARTVLAVDTSRALLDELAAAKGDRAIRTEQADLRAFTTLVAPGSADAIACMGDTLPHLDHRGDVFRLFDDAHDRLCPGGWLVLTFRDLSAEPRGLDRFLPVRADDDRIMLCALDYAPETVTVSDLIHVRSPEGWTLRKSSYRKLRLSPADLTAGLERTGFSVTHDRACGRMHAIVARKR